jgi:methanethiol S-methyltransferase
MMNQSGFWWVLIAGAVFGAIHSLTASLQLKLVVSQHFGEPGRKFYRFGYMILSLITTLLYLALVVLLPDKRIYLIPPPWIYLSGFLQLLTLIGMALSSGGTGMISFPGLESLPEKNTEPVKNTLMTNGFYAYTRHPIYFFLLVFLWLFPLMTWNILAFAIGVTLYTLIGSRFEERKLIHEFGQAYIDYRKVTPWIIPIKLK